MPVTHLLVDIPKKLFFARLVTHVTPFALPKATLPYQIPQGLPPALPYIGYLSKTTNYYSKQSIKADKTYSVSTIYTRLLEPLVDRSS